MAPSRWLTLRNTTMDGDQIYTEPLTGMVISVILAMISLVIISAFLTQRYLAVKIWARLPFVQWIVFAIYADSFLFVFATGILQFGFGVGYSMSVCESAILLCLACYVTTKILIYIFLVEKAFIIRSGTKKLRMRSKLYLFNSFGMIGVYCVVVVLNFIYRITKVENGQCIIGMQRPAMIPLISFDLLVNIYLTLVFLIPLTRLYTYKNFQETPGSRRLRTVAIRTFVGCICTLTSSVVNLSVLMALDGEPGWVCLMCCNSDILFSAIVIQWVTSRDSTSSASNESQSASRPHSNNNEELNGLNRQRAARRQNSEDDADTKPTASHHKSQLALSTEAIVSDAAPISTTNTDRGDVSPCSNNTFCEDKDRHSPAAPSEDETNGRTPRIPPAAARYHTASTSEVRVDVNYGASLSSDIEGNETTLGNSIVIGSGTSVISGGGSGSTRRAKGSPWRYTDGAVPGVSVNHHVDGGI
ncbi:hypothetical protein QBC38DRAFT_228773 [Podospora fimiseda]|uniref:Uncharacterized protein n=1 Tax=Podospora fimiseda TaxID=252190 RepID=A0AAN7H2Q6_9PEZI|nr:hypothetical protein QBC38DRAFT_228773 [Podospora fimiseda]